MPKQEHRVEVNGFIKGLISEASPLNFPDNASFDESNFVLRKDGTRNRRFGLDVEPNGIFVDSMKDESTGIDNPPPAYRTFVWESVGGDPNKSYLVVSILGFLIFFNYDNGTITNTTPVARLQVMNPLARGRLPESFTSIEGYLVTVSNSGIVIIDKDFQIYLRRIKVRDAWGIQESDSFENNPLYRSGAMDANHLYNLRNQSWAAPRRQPEDPYDFKDPVDLMFTRINVMPSNSEVVWTGMQTRPPATTGALQGVSNEVFFPAYMDDIFGSQLKAPKGFFILDDVTARGASRRSVHRDWVARYPQLNQMEITFKEDVSGSGPYTLASMSGHVFFAGFDGTVVDGDARSPNLSNYVFFSQLVKSKKEINLCYQEGDPTSRDSADVVDTDGGFIKISGARNILSLHPIGLSMVVVADNGVWAITGQDINSGFSATSYKVSKVSNFGGVGRGQSTLVVGNILFFLSEEGIFAIQPTDLGNMELKSLSEGTIQKFYSKISSAARNRAFAIYDPVNKKIRWLFNLNLDADGNNFWNNQKYMELVYDVNLQAFEKNDIAGLDGYALVAPFQASLKAHLVQDQVEETSFVRYILLKREATLKFTVVDFNNKQWRDFQFIDGVGIDAKAYCLTGYQIAGDSVVDKQAPYLVMHFYRTEKTTDNDAVPKEQSSCMFRIQWNFSNSEASNKWSPLREAYRYVKPMLAFPNSQYDTGFDIISTKNKVRGNGRSFALYFETSPYKACNIVGWNLTLTANTVS